MDRKAFRKALESGVPQLGFLGMYPAPGIIERAGADWDWVWIDGQHGELGYQDVLAMVRACDLIGRPGIVRVASHEFGRIGLALDTGASGIIVPVVSTPAEALAVVHAAKFPPLGGRSYGGRRPIDREGRLYSDTANEDVLLVVQVETPEAVENADSIAAIPGIDALFYGPDDVALRRGQKMNAVRSRETLAADLTAVARACARHGKFAVTVGVNPEIMALAAELGFAMIVGGGDVGFIAAGSKQASADARALLKGIKPRAAAGSPGASY